MIDLIRMRPHVNPVLTAGRRPPPMDGVLEIQATPGQLNITLDLVIGWAHPSYRDPLEGEVACFRKAVVEFPAVQELTWTRQSRIRPTVDAGGERDWGAIEVVSQEPIVRIVGS
jgi:hypothetical protein